MDTINALASFMEKSGGDRRIGTTHIGLFTAALHYSTTTGGCNPIKAYSKDIMCLAKISALRTYCRCLKELDEYGYLHYIPSKKKNVPSSIFFMEPYRIP